MMTSQLFSAALGIQSPWSVQGVDFDEAKRQLTIKVDFVDLSNVYEIAIDETSSRRGHNYLTLAADMTARRVVFVTEGRDSQCIVEFAQCLRDHRANPYQIESVSINMSPAFIKGVDEHLPLARVTFDKFHVVAHASAAVDKMRRIEQKNDPALKGMRWALLKDRSKLSSEQRADLDALVTQFTSKRTARAWLYREQLRDILQRKQIHVVSAMLTQ